LRPEVLALLRMERLVLADLGYLFEEIDRPREQQIEVANQMVPPES
jgi:hypothetical protein